MTDSTSFLELARFETPLTERFQDWLRSSKPGAVFVYCSAPNLGDKRVTDEERVTADLARVAFADGLVELCQRKRNDNLGYLRSAKEARAAKANRTWNTLGSEDY